MRRFDVLLIAAALALATIPLGTEWTAASQLAALTLIISVALVVEARRQRTSQS